MMSLHRHPGKNPLSVSEVFQKCGSPDARASHVSLLFEMLPLSKASDVVTVRTRFAPSPTGQLHLGHALAARVAHETARGSVRGQFLLRHEDLDGARVREAFYQAIEDDLEWLGLSWDGDALRQSTRMAAYELALERLRGNGLIYRCFCTRREIQDEWARIAAAPQGAAMPVYPGTCRRLTPGQQRQQMDAGAPYAWRLDSRRAADLAGPLTFHDLCFGSVDVDPELLGDVVLSRKDTGCSYHLAVVVDDAFQHITHVTRGDDLLASTHVHRLLQFHLGLPEPLYLHHPLILDDHGIRLAKRSDSLAIATLREAGKMPAEVLALTDHGLPSAF